MVGEVREGRKDRGKMRGGKGRYELRKKGKRDKRVKGMKREKKGGKE